MKLLKKVLWAGPLKEARTRVYGQVITQVWGLVDELVFWQVYWQVWNQV